MHFYAFFPQFRASAHTYIIISSLLPNSVWRGGWCLTYRFAFLLPFWEGEIYVAPCCGARKNHRTYANPRFFRPLPLAHLASSATGSARLAPQCLHWSKRYATGISHLDGFESHHPWQKQKHHPIGWCLAFGGGWWIRTTEGIASRFTVCPLWPLGKSPIFKFCMMPVWSR